MRALGIDVGTVRVGLALSDPLGYTAQPLEVIKRTNPARDLEAVRRIVEEKQVEVLVVGLPLNMNGTEGPAAEMARAFAALLAPLELPVEFIDERTSSLMADAVLVQADVSRAKRKQVRDKMAAAVLLQTWLDGRRQSRLT
ncbi:MAG TPA: Holliday junction resolvase RuvX [bacterium]|nr:Holliday junction resolvase RuvX [bacterium]